MAVNDGRIGLRKGCLVMKSKFTVAGIIVMVATILVAAGIVVYGLNFSRSYVKSQTGYEGDHVGTLWYEFTAERDGQYYSISMLDGEDRYIAFSNDSDEFEMDYAAGSYYPDNYWNGEGEEMDFSSDFLEYYEFRHRDSDVNSEYIKDVSVFEDETTYYTRGKPSQGYYKGSWIKSTYSALEKTTVYESSSFVGAEKPENSKALVATFGMMGVIGAVIVFAFIGIFVGGALLVVGLVRSSRK